MCVHKHYTKHRLPWTSRNWWFACVYTYTYVCTVCSLCLCTVRVYVFMFVCFHALQGVKYVKVKSFNVDPLLGPSCCTHLRLNTCCFVSLLAREMGIPPLEILRCSKVVKNTLSSLSLKSWIRSFQNPSSMQHIWYKRGFLLSQPFFPFCSSTCSGWILKYGLHGRLSFFFPNSVS